METYKILGVKTSPPCRAVFLTAKALNVNLDFEHVDMLEDKHKTNAELLKYNILAKVPVLMIDSGKRSIVDSHAINAYLVDKNSAGNDLYPKDTYTRAQIDRMLHFDSSILFPRLNTMFYKVCYTDEVTQLEPIKIEYFKQALSMLEKLLENKKYLVGNNLTLADISCVTSVTSAIGVIQVDKNNHPNIYGWIDRLKKLPYYEEANERNAKDLHNFINKRLEEYEQILSAKNA